MSKQKTRNKNRSMKKKLMKKKNKNKKILQNNKPSQRKKNPTDINIDELQNNSSTTKQIVNKPDKKNKKSRFKKIKGAFKNMKYKIIAIFATAVLFLLMFAGLIQAFINY